MDQVSQSIEPTVDEPGQFYADKPNKSERHRSNKRTRRDINQKLRRVSGSNWKDYIEDENDEEALQDDS